MCVGERAADRKQWPLAVGRRTRRAAPSCNGASGGGAHTRGGAAGRWRPVRRPRGADKTCPPMTSRGRASIRLGRGTLNRTLPRGGGFWIRKVRLLGGARPAGVPRWFVKEEGAATRRVGATRRSPQQTATQLLSRAVRAAVALATYTRVCPRPEAWQGHGGSRVGFQCGGGELLQRRDAGGQAHAGASPDCSIACLVAD